MTLRALLATWGSAGDLFPLVAVARRLIADGHEVRCAAPRAAGLYLRTAGIPSIAYGDGSEMQVFGDPEIFTNDDDGWASWVHMVERYVAPTFAADVASLTEVLSAWRPDVVGAASFAAAPRQVAHALGIPVLDVSIYPQHDPQTITDRFAGLLPGDGSAAGRDVWGSPPDLWLHDPALLGGSPSGTEAIGFPAWDALPAAGPDEAAAERWACGPGPHLLVTLGSFVGAARRVVLDALAASVTDLTAHVLFVGGSGGRAFGDGETERVTSVGYIPLSTVLPHADVAVHHGGIGTTVAAIRCGVPAVVLPQAFDQGFNARLIESAGLGRQADTSDIGTAVATLLADPSVRSRTQEIAGRLVPTDVAVARVYDALLERSA